MQIYFACSIIGGRQDEGVYQNLVQALQDLGVQVPTAHIAETGIEEVDAQVNAWDIYHRDVTWIEESDSLIAEVSTPSHGVGYEIAYALGLGKPVLCLHRRDVLVSKMITGNPHPLLQVSAYNTWQEAGSILEQFVADTGWVGS